MSGHRPFKELEDKMSPERRRKNRLLVIQASVRQILWRDWNPIAPGVPEDEYDAYVGPVLGLLEKGSEIQEIADYLCWVESERMGLSQTDKSRLVSVAKKLKEIDVDLG